MIVYRGTLFICWPPHLAFGIPELFPCNMDFGCSLRVLRFCFGAPLAMRLRGDLLSVPGTGCGRKNNDRTKPWIVGHSRKEYVVGRIMGSPCCWIFRAERVR